MGPDFHRYDGELRQKSLNLGVSCRFSMGLGVSPAHATIGKPLRYGRIHPKSQGRANGRDSLEWDGPIEMRRCIRTLIIGPYRCR